MGALNWLRNTILGPPHIEYGSGDEGAEAEAAMSDEMPDAAEDEANLERSEAPPGLPAYEPQAGIAAFEDAETEHDDANSEEAPPDKKS